MMLRTPGQFTRAKTPPMNRFVKAIAFGACAFGGGTAGTLLLNRADPLVAQTSRPAPPPAGPTTLSPAQLGERFEAVIRQMAPTVVSVEAIKPPAPGKTKPTEESGSGVVVRIEGVPGILVITNNHVINGSKAEQITVHLADDKIYRPVKVWADPESDVAALKLDADGLIPAPLADSDRVREGNWVLAFGSPFGLNRTVTHGIISALVIAARSAWAARSGSRTSCKRMPRSTPAQAAARS